MTDDSAPVTVLTSKIKNYEDLDSKIMAIVHRLVDNNQIIELNRLYRLCLNELKVDSAVILNKIESLNQSKKFLFGQKIIRDLILSNPTRKSIYNLLQIKPGLRFTDILNEVELNKNMLQWNLEVLMRFECLREIVLNKNQIYGIFDDSASKILMHYYMRNENFEPLIRILQKKPCSMKELVLISNFSYNVVFYNVNQLIKLNIVKIELDKTDKIYMLTSDFEKELSNSFKL